VKKSLELGIFQVVITLISGYFMDNFGRRILMLGGVSLIILSLLGGCFMLEFSSSSSDSSLVIYLIFMHIGSFSLSLGPVTVVYISEIIEDISPFMTIIWVETIFIALTSNLMIERFGISKVFLLYALICMSGLFYVSRYMIESRGISRVEILKKYYKANARNGSTSNNGSNDEIIMENVQYLHVKN
jgi:MFS family permease